MVFYGASGHAKVIIEAWVASGGTVTGIVDDDEGILNLLTFPVSGKYRADKFNESLFIVSIGTNTIRKKIANSIRRKFGKVIHPSAIISTSAALGVGTVIMAGAIINAACSIGDHVIINTSAAIDHDCGIGDFVHISPNATICGGVEIGEGAHIGAGATVIQNIRIGKWATIGAGSVIIEDVPDQAVAVGVPGKIKKFNKV